MRVGRHGAVPERERDAHLAVCGAQRHAAREDDAMDDPTPPRISPVERAQATPAQLEVLEPFGPGPVLNLFGTLAHHPKLLRSWLHLGGRLLYGGLLPARDRELLILRSSARCGSDYEWGQHVGIARDAGLSDDEILACAADVPGEPLDEADQALLSAADELVVDHCVSDDTWAALQARYDDAALIEITMLVGQYAMLAGLLRSIDVQTEQPLPRIGSVS